MLAFVETWCVPIHVIAGRNDRFLPIELQRRVGQKRLHVGTIDNGVLAVRAAVAEGTAR
jgi:pimeloyl-ACP methyl ester carboxylesterase